MSTLPNRHSAKPALQAPRKLLIRESGASIAQMRHAFGWQPHTVRAAISAQRNPGCEIMGTTDAPWHSRPIDADRWSDHPEAAQRIDRIWDGYLPSDQTSGAKTKSQFKHQVFSLNDGGNSW
ncbi:MAG: DUF3489 domain-containing protein [Ruegeria sp.]